MTREVVAKRLQDMMIQAGVDPKTGSTHRLLLEDYYMLSENSIQMFASGEDKEKGIAEYEFRFGSKPKPNPDRYADLKPTENKPFRGLRIALDPGHIGGEVGTEFERIEARYIHYPKGAVLEREVRFNEGNLNYATALLLRDQLKAGGASEVLITRPGYGVSAMGDTFFSWLGKKDEASGKWLNKKGSESGFELAMKPLKKPVSDWWKDE